jgi:hypothetical protein
MVGSILLNVFHCAGGTTNAFRRDKGKGKVISRHDINAYGVGEV